MGFINRMKKKNNEQIKMLFLHITKIFQRKRKKIGLRWERLGMYFNSMIF